MSLPDVLSMNPSQTVENMTITTEVLDPITITDQRAVFQIPKTGILDSGSFVQLGVTVSTTGDFFFPLTTGIHGLIESATLKIGNKVVATNLRYPQYTTAMRQFESPEHRAFVDMVKSGTCGDRFSTVDSSASRLAYRDLITASSGASQTVPAFITPTTSDDTTPLFSVPLSTLIPMMKTRKLPLFAMKEHVYLELTFTQQKVDADIGSICCRTGGSQASSLVTVSKPNIKFHFDSLYYTDDTMDALMQSSVSQDGMTILYEDLIVTDTSIPALGAAPTGTQEQRVERELALAGRTVRTILFQDKPQGYSHAFLGNYVSRDTVQPSSINYRINDQRYYDRDVVDPTRKYDELAGVGGKPLMVPSQLYSFDADTNSSGLTQNSTFVGTVEGHQCPDDANADATTEVDMRGTSHYEGVDLTTSGVNQLGVGMKIGVQPVRVLKTYARTAQDFGARELRAFASVERLMVLRNGEVMITA